MPNPLYTKEEHARRGSEIYAREIAPKIEAANRGRIVAIDVDSGEFEVADQGFDAAQRLLSRHPGAQIWCVKIGYPAVHRFGPRARSAGP
jgi:hypothetical protein